MRAVLRAVVFALPVFVTGFLWGWFAAPDVGASVYDGSDGVQSCAPRRSVRSA